MKITKAKLKQIIREELLREIGPGAGMAPTQQYGLGMRGGISDDTPQKLEDYLIPGKFLVQLLDPTAITTLIDPEYQESMKAARKAYKTAKTADAKVLALGMLALQAAAAIPLVGKVIGIPAKVARAALKAGPKSARTLKLANNALEQGVKNIDDVERAIEQSGREVAKKADWLTRKTAERMGTGFGKSESIISRSAAKPLRLEFDGQTGKLMSRQDIKADNMLRVNDGFDPKAPGTILQRDMVVVRLPNDELQPFYRRTGSGGDGGAGGGGGNWVPIDGYVPGAMHGAPGAPIWMNKSRFYAGGETDPLFRYGTDPLKQIGTWLDDITQGVKPGNLTNDPLVANAWLNTPATLRSNKELKRAIADKIVVPGSHMPANSPALK
jgi:hypothetical protein